MSRKPNATSQSLAGGRGAEGRHECELLRNLHCCWGAGERLGGRL